MIKGRGVSLPLLVYTRIVGKCYEGICFFAVISSILPIKSISMKLS